MRSSALPRVVATGLGAVSSIGSGKQQFWQNLLAGTSGITEVEGFDTSEFPTHIGGEIKNFRPDEYVDKDRVAAYGRSSLLGIAATTHALSDAGFDAGHINKVASCVIVGTTMGESDAQETLMQTYVQSGMEHFQKADVLRLPDSLIALNIAHEHGLASNCMVIPTACAAGNYAIGYGYDLIRMGRAEVVIVGGSDAFSKVSYIGFSRMMALAPDQCRPFDRNRQGIVIGEGAGVIVLESLQHALARNARIYAEVVGYGLSCDAYHMTIPHLDGIVAVMSNALASAGLEPGSIDAISAHGTGTQMNDKTESAAIHKVFGKRASQIPVNAIKSMLGHTMGAASAFEAIACIMTLYDGKIPPTINYSTADDECKVDCVPNEARNIDANMVLNNSFAFGANNAATIFARYQ